MSGAMASISRGWQRFLDSMPAPWILLPVAAVVALSMLLLTFGIFKPEPSIEERILALQQEQKMLLEQKLEAIREQIRTLKELCGQP